MNQLENDIKHKNKKNCLEDVTKIRKQKLSKYNRFAIDCVNVDVISNNYLIALADLKRIKKA